MNLTYSEIEFDSEMTPAIQVSRAVELIQTARRPKPRFLKKTGPTYTMEPTSMPKQQANQLMYVQDVYSAGTESTKEHLKLCASILFSSSIHPSPSRTTVLP